MAKIPSAVLPKSLLVSNRHKALAIRVSPILVESAGMSAAGIYAQLNTRPLGLTADEAAARLAQHGPNVLARDRRAGLGKLLWRALLNPLVILLAVLATISFATGDFRAGIMMVPMIVLSVGLKLIQESRAGVGWGASVAGALVHRRAALRAGAERGGNALAPKGQNAEAH